MAAPAGNSEFRDAKYGYVVSPPEFPGPSAGASVLRLAANGPAEAGFAPNMTVMVQEITTTRDQYVAGSKAQTEAIGLTMISTSTREVSGQPAAVLEYEGQMGTRQMHFLALAVILPERVLLVTYTAPASSFKGLEAEFRRSLESFKLPGQ